MPDQKMRDVVDAVVTGGAEMHIIVRKDLAAGEVAAASGPPLPAEQAPDQQRGAPQRPKIVR